MVGSKKLDEQVYEQNVKFWDRAWSPVKTPYTQMPDLPYIQAIPDTLTAKGAKTVLDLGCGSGWLAIFLARAGFQVTGIDVAVHAIELAQAWAAQEDLTNAQFAAADITDIPFGENAFDACVANSIFEHLTWELAVATMEQLRKILKPGGVFFGCFDKVGTGPGEYYKLDDGTQVYTDKGRSGMMLRFFNDDELRKLFDGWKIESMETIESGSRIVWATTPT
jgi:SAM-dependent methyltransferase